MDMFRADNLEAAKGIAKVEGKRLGKRLQVYHPRGTKTWWVCTAKAWKAKGFKFDK